MIIDSSGQVGIGTDAPSSLLHVATTESSNEIRLEGDADPSLTLKVGLKCALNNAF